jgi:acetoin:2,6-dichlorophenolindophenol oxidoreductase subunit alpha
VTEPSTLAAPPAAAGATLSRLSDADLSALLSIRHFEQALLDCFSQGLVAGTTHTCLGQEHVPVAMEGLLRADDHVFSNHRGHGHYLARFGDPAGLLAEIMGRAGAVCGGYGGSQHLLRDTYMSTGVQGQSLSMATGVALHLRSSPPPPDRDSPMVCVYIGDGTWGEGAVYEALNVAGLWQLPVLVVVENNGIAQSTPTASTMSGSIAGRAAAFGVPHQRCSSVDVNQLRRDLAGTVDAVRRGGPAVVEFIVPRLGPHSKGDDSREPHELAELRIRDWAALYRDSHPEHFDTVDRRQRTAIADVVRDVTTRPLAEARDV